MNGKQKISDIRGARFFSVGDIAVYAALLVLIAVFTLFAFADKNEKGTRFEILYRGETIFSAGLDRDAVYLFYIDGDGQGKVTEKNAPEGISDYNVIEVKDGKASVVASDCPDKVCYGSGVCLPHRMTLKIYYDDWGTDL